MRYPLKRRGPKPRSRAREYSTGTRSPTPGFENQEEEEDDYHAPQTIEEEETRQPAALLSPIAQRLASSPHNWAGDASTSGAALLAAQTHSPLSQVALPPLPPLYDVYQDLLITLSRVLPASSFEAITKKCIDLFFQYLFPLNPIVDERNLRRDLHLVCAIYGSPNGSSPAPAWPAATGAFESGPIASPTNPRDTTALAVKLALVTATCAEAAFMIPPQLFPEGPLIASALLHASRSALHSYLERDLEHPSATSLATRYFHSNCLHAAGKSRVSWHIFGEAARLAQTMHLHSEAAYEGLEPTEAELRRRCFWILCTGDKSAAILNGLPIALHPLNFVSETTVAHPTEAGNLVFDPQAGDDAPRSVLTGFNFNVRLWAAASALLLEIRKRAGGAADDREAVDRLYIDFMTVLDTLPPWLSLDPSLSEEAGRCPNEFCIQRVNLRVSFHCLRLVVLQRLEDVEMGVGATANGLAAALRKTEIARDMVRVVRQAPFWALQVNGESCVSLCLFLRRVWGLFCGSRRA